MILLLSDAYQSVHTTGIREIYGAIHLQPDVIKAMFVTLACYIKNILTIYSFRCSSETHYIQHCPSVFPSAYLHSF